MDPFLYGFTDDGEIAKEFNRIRKNLHLIEKRCTKEEWKQMRLNFGDYLIIPDELMTRVNNIGCGKVRIYLTEREAEHFRLHCDEIATAQLGFNTINPDIFDDEFRKSLDLLGFSDCYNACMDEVSAINRFGLELPYPEVSARLFKGKYILDELQLFIQHKRDTFFGK